MVFFVSDGEGGEGRLAAGTEQADTGAIERLHRLDQTGGDLLAGGDEGNSGGIGPDVFPADLPDAVVQEGQAAGGHGGLFQGYAAGRQLIGGQGFGGGFLVGTGGLVQGQ